jgi:hypothetical protein
VTQQTMRLTIRANFQIFSLYCHVLQKDHFDTERFSREPTSVRKPPLFYLSTAEPAMVLISFPVFYLLQHGG